MNGRPLPYGLEIRALWHYRGFIVSSVKNELIGRFNRSWLGGFWSILQPLLQASILALVLSKVLAAKLPGLKGEEGYALYLLAGTLGWSVFQDTLMRCLGLFVGHGGLLKKIDFPHLTLPIIVLLTTTLNHFFLFLSILVISLALGHWPGLVMLWVFPVALIAGLLGLGVGLTLGIFNVFIRDLEQLVPILLQMTYWFTPIVYPLNAIPESLQALLAFNPIYGFIKAYQAVMVFDTPPDLGALAQVLGLTLLTLALALMLLRRAGPELVDAL